MKTLSLPSGKLIWPVQVQSVLVQQHFFNRRFYVEISLRNGSTEYVGEKLTKEEAEAVQKKYLAMVRDADVGPYEVGHEDGYQKGYEQGRKEGYDDGYSSGYSACGASAAQSERDRFMTPINAFLADLVTEQQNAREITPDRRRYLRHSISAITDLIARLPASSD